MKGYFSIGLAGYEVEVLDDEHVTWQYVGPSSDGKKHRAKIYFNSDGHAFFRAGNLKIFLEECLRII